MIKGKYIFLIACLLIVIAAIGFSVKRDTIASKDLVKVDTSTFPVKGGWGYNILVDNKIFIHQEFIPSISGYEAFRTRQDAEKIAEYQTQKMLQKKVPSVSVHELDSLQISY
jgi:Domain of unknown function (DUF4907)